MNLSTVNPCRLKKKVATVLCLSLSFFSAFAEDGGDEKNLCEALFPNLPADHPEFIRAVVRDPKTPLIDGDYPKRVHDSLHNVFIPWFSSLPLDETLDFKTMLREQHRILVKGLDGTAVYRGASRIEHNIATGYVVAPSVFRYEFAPHSGPFGFSFRQDLYLSRNRSQDLLSLIERFKRNRDPNSLPEPSDKTVDMLPIHSSALQLLELPRVGRNIRTWNVVYEQYITHIYFASDSLPVVMVAMEKIMEEVKLLFNLEKNVPHRNTNKLLRLLAEYVYLGVHSHFFMGANFSLFMCQANYILSQWNLRGISHSNLDYVAMALPFAEFDQRFREDILEANPLERSAIYEMSSFPEHNLSSPSLRDETVLAHIANIGDRPFWGDDYIGDRESGFQLEGVLVPPPRTLPSDVELVYQAILAGTGKTPWLPAGSFIGTRGQSRGILGIAFKLTGPNSEKLTVKYSSKRRTGETTEFSNGAETTWEEGNPMVGLKIHIGYSPE